MEGDLWTKQHQQTFDEVKDSLIHAVTLAHVDPGKLLCLFTDASDAHWASVLTQIPPCDLTKPFDQQLHEPLAFLAGSFRSSQARWSTPEKEAYAIIASVDRLDYLLLRPEGFLLFTDHKNLTYIFDPVRTNPRMPKHVFNKIQRWALMLAAFRYEVVHIPGTENIWADLMSRWGTPTPPTSIALLRRAMSTLFTAPLAPYIDEKIEWPTAEEVATIQAEAIREGEKLPDAPEKRNGVLTDAQGAVWIPADAVNLQLRLCIIGHCGRGGHRGVTTTLKNICEHFFWRTMRADITSFCNTCLHCEATTGGLRKPRPFAHTMHADRPNQLLHFDFLYMNESRTGEKYVLILKDDASSFIWLRPSEAPDAETATQALLEWFASFGVVPYWCSDRGTHFKNKLIGLINKQLRAHHHFTTPYCPQSNGTVEAVCKEVLRACRSLLSEFRMREDEWPEVVPLIQSILNHSKRPTLGDRAPITVFTGLPADNPLRTLFQQRSFKAKDIEFVDAQRIANTERLIRTLSYMHKEVRERRTKKRLDAIKRHNANTCVQEVNFNVGDFVLVAKREKDDGHKLRVTWQGPRRIIRAVSELVFECEDLISGSRSLIHANRLKRYSDRSLNITEELLGTIDNNSPHLQTVEELLQLRFNEENQQYEVRVKWVGFDYEEPTWEPLAVMQEDIPVLLAIYLQRHPDQELVNAARDSLNF